MCHWWLCLNERDFRRQIRAHFVYLAPRSSVQTQERQRPAARLSINHCADLGPPVYLQLTSRPAYRRLTGGSLAHQLAGQLTSAILEPISSSISSLKTKVRQI